MARKVINTTYSASRYDLLSQTPGNYAEDNYFLKQLQDKVNADWRYRPNRVTIEYESVKADLVNRPFESEWLPIEVVEQTVKNDTGKDISQDYLNLVFRDIKEKRFTIGSKFRMGSNYDIATPDDQKLVWLVYNTARTGVTKSVTVRRCNGVLGSTFVDPQGVTHYHYEPVIQSGDLTSTNLFYNQVANAAKSQMVIIAQDNDFTKLYKMNQRFIVGARYKDQDGKWMGQVFRVNAIDRANSNSTYNPEDAGLIKIYLEVTELSPYDNFEQRIAYQEDNTSHITDGSGQYQPVIGDEKVYSIGFTAPTEFPKALGSTEVKFIPVLMDQNGEVVKEANEHISTSFELENCPAGKQGSYIEFVEHPASESEPYYFTLRRKKMYLNGPLTVMCMVPGEYTPSEETVTSSFELVVREQEV